MHDPHSPAPEATRTDEPQHSNDSKTGQSGPIDPTLVPMTVGMFAPSGSSHEANPTPSAMINRRLGQYELLDLLGQGGMGSVFRARHVNLDKLVALKLLPADFMRTEQAVARFKREMKAVGKIDHPNIVRAMDAGDVDGTHYLTMELVEGTDLAKLVKARGPFSVRDACKVIRQAALGLDAAHKGGLIHRDIKPANLLLAKSGQIKILDLGLASMADDTAVHDGITSSGQVLGTPDFMAPEQWEDTHTAEARTDLYALGCTLFYLLTGRAPFATDEFKSVVRKMYAHVNSPIPDLLSVRTDIPAGVIAIYERLMAKRPEERFATAGELAQSLIPFTSGKSLESKSPIVETLTQSTMPLAATDVLPSVTTAAEASPERDVTQPTGELRSLSPPVGRNWKQIGIWGGGIVALLLGVIIITITIITITIITITIITITIITITNKDGSKTKIEVPAGSTVEVVTKPSRPLDESKPVWREWPADAPRPAVAPFDATQAKKHQQMWADFLNVPVEFTNSIGMKFVLVPPGEFAMGSSAVEVATAVKLAGDDPGWPEKIRSESPLHPAIVTQGLYIGVHEVTQRQYSAVMQTNPAHFSSAGLGRDLVANVDSQDFPVEQVSWNDAAEFCAKLSLKEELKPFYFRTDESVIAMTGTGYRLPSEAEWEFACRAGTTTKHWIGDRDEDLLFAAQFSANAGLRTHRVGELKGNPWGLFDVHGNVWEWVDDGWDPKSYQSFTDQPAIDPRVPKGDAGSRSIRGGDWSYDSTYSRSAIRHAHDPTHKHNNLGFRVSLPLEGVKASLKQ